MPTTASRQLAEVFMRLVFGLLFCINSETLFVCCSLRCAVDTATEVALLAISAAAPGQGIPIYWILLLPSLFTAAMAMIDTLDGILMVHLRSNLFSIKCICGARAVLINQHI